MIILSRKVLATIAILTCLAPVATGQGLLGLPDATMQLPFELGVTLDDPSIGATGFDLRDALKHEGIEWYGRTPCEACMPGPIVVPLPPPTHWPPPRPTGGTSATDQDCLIELTCIPDAIIERSWFRAGPISPLVAAPMASAEMTYDDAVIEVMRETTADNLCLLVVGIILPGVAGPCLSGTLSVEQDLTVSVTPQAEGAADFFIEIWGRSALLAGVGAYEHHTYNLAFGLKLDGEPRILLFNSLPLYTTWNDIGMVKKLIDDVKYIPRKQDDLLRQLNNRFSRGFGEFLEREAVNAYYD